MSLGLILAGVLGGGLGFLLAVMCSPLQRLVIAAILAVPQFIVPGLPESVSVFQVWVLFMALTPGWYSQEATRSIYTKILMALGILTVFVAVWSPLPMLAIISAAQILSFAILSVYAAGVLKQNPGGLSKVFGWLGVGVVMESLLVILFRMSPDLEMQFLRSDVGRILIGSDKLYHNFNGYRDNVFDVVKSGGVWVNANTASMFLGVAACAFVVAALRFRKKSFLFVALLAAVAVIPTGSKSGLVLLVSMPLVGILASLFVRRSARIWIPAVLAFSFPASVFLMYIVDNQVPESLASDSASSLGTRGVIWETAAVLFSQKPFLGLGFGGWNEGFYSASGGALGRTFPPHNILITAWSETGIAGAIILLVFIIVVLVAHIRFAGGQPHRRDALAWGFGLAAFLWLFIHGMADAVTFYGDLRTMLIPALLLGILMVQPQRADAPALTDSRSCSPPPMHRK